MAMQAVAAGKKSRLEPEELKTPRKNPRRRLEIYWLYKFSCNPDLAARNFK
jgi:hypothetical protein